MGSLLTSQWWKFWKAIFRLVVVAAAVTVTVVVFVFVADMCLLLFFGLFLVLQFLLLLLFFCPFLLLLLLLLIFESFYQRTHHSWTTIKSTFTFSWDMSILHKPDIFCDSLIFELVYFCQNSAIKQKRYWNFPTGCCIY